MRERKWRNYFAIARSRRTEYRDRHQSRWLIRDCLGMHAGIFSHCGQVATTIEHDAAIENTFQHFFAVQSALGSVDEHASPVVCHKTQLGYLDERVHAIRPPPAELGCPQNFGIFNREIYRLGDAKAETGGHDEHSCQAGWGPAEVSCPPASSNVSRGAV